jgi:hypothetical protein
MIIPAILTLAAIGVSMYAANQQAAAQAKSSAAQANILEQNAANTEAEFHERTLRLRRQNRGERDSMVAKIAKSKLSTTSASALEIIGEAAGRQELAIKDAARKANQDASDSRQRASVARFEGAQAKSAGSLSMLGIGLKGAASAYGDYKNPQT